MDDLKPKWVPPYIAFPTLTGLIERMQGEGGPPSRMDRSYLDKFSGGYQTQVLAALKSLDLMGPNGEVRPVLTALVEAPDADGRKPIYADLIRRLYPKPVSLGTTKATQGQLVEAFKEYGITGDTLRKAIAFYLAAAKYAAIPVSTNFKVPSVTPGEGRKVNRKPRGSGSSNPGSGDDGNTADIETPLDKSWQQQIEPVVLEWLKRIPAKGQPWSKQDRTIWNSVLATMLDGIYGTDQ